MSRPALGWFLAAFGCYGLGAARGPMWADGSKLTIYALHGYLPSLNPGDHAAWTLFARLWLALTPWLDPVHSLHLFSAFSGALAVALAFYLVVRRDGDIARAHTMASVLLVAQPLWWSASLAETYALAIALVLGVAVVAEKTPTVLIASFAGILVGLAAATHAFSLFLTIPLLAAWTLRWWPVVGLGALLGAAPAWTAVFGAPLDPMTGHQAAGADTWAWHAGTFLRPGAFVEGLVLIAAGWLFALGPIGLSAFAVRQWRQQAPHRRPAFAIASTLALVLMISMYSPYRLHLMALMPLVGLLLVFPPSMPRSWRIVHVCVQSLLYLAAPLAAHALGRADLAIRRIPERDNAWYFLCPLKAWDAGPERYARALLAASPERATVLADFNPGAVLRLVQERERLRPDVTIVPTAVDETLGQADPAAALAARIRSEQRRGRPVVLADSWEPYYRTGELTRRLGVRLFPCGPGLGVAAPSPR